MTRIRLGMVGGGNDAFIGAVHRIASRIDDRYELVAGALSSTPEKAKASGAALGLDPARCYGTFEEMANREAARTDGVQAVSIVTPNHVHFPAASAFLQRGIHVICDKPLTSTLADAEALADAVARSSALFFLTHNYTGYPMVRQARQMVADGLVGTVRVVQVEYPQDWLTTSLEKEGLKQAEWRTDPARSGAGGSIGDIGTHAHNLAGFVTGLEVEALAADLQCFGAGRVLDDNAHILLRYRGGARGMLWSQPSRARQRECAPAQGLWRQGRFGMGAGGPELSVAHALGRTETPDPTCRRRRDGRAAAAVSRIPAGHPEGYLEGFANIYTGAADAIAAALTGAALPDDADLLPGIDAGLAGMRFITACVASSNCDAAWVKL